MMSRREVILALWVAAILVFCLVPFVSQRPDGLEKVAEDRGFAQAARHQSFLMADYRWPGIKNETFSRVGAGVFGLLLLFGLGSGIGLLVRRVSKNNRS